MNKVTKKENKSNNKKIKIKKVKEIGGPKGPEPTRYGDWELRVEFLTLKKILVYILILIASYI